MTRAITTTAVLGAALALAFAAGPASAAQRAAHPGYEARAQAIPDSPRDDGVSAARAKALEQCNTAAQGMTDYTWGVRKSEVYDACMAKQGQPE